MNDTLLVGLILTAVGVLLMVGGWLGLDRDRRGWELGVVLFAMGGLVLTSGVACLIVGSFLAPAP